jgi:hypothetical protein
MERAEVLGTFLNSFQKPLLSTRNSYCKIFFNSLNNLAQLICVG